MIPMITGIVSALILMALMVMLILGGLSLLAWLVELMPRQLGGHQRPIATTLAVVAPK